jgi:RTX calcium-binding nonapeptide repeat (4 copies)
MTFGTSKLLAPMALAVMVHSLVAPFPTSATPLCLGRAPTIVGSAEGGRLVGTPGPDVIAGRGGDDRIHGLGGNDRICGGRGNDVLLAGPGRDLVDGGVGDDRGNAGSGDDRFLGGPGADSLWGDAFDASGNDVLLGGGGSDLFNPRDGQDLIRGGTGRDGVAYWEADGIRVNLRTGVARGWGRDPSTQWSWWWVLCLTTSSSETKGRNVSKAASAMTCWLVALGAIVSWGTPETTRSMEVLEMTSWLGTMASTEWTTARQMDPSRPISHRARPRAMARTCWLEWNTWSVPRTTTH